MTQTLPLKLHLPSTPRPVTRHVTGRSWGEGAVRFWWGSAIVVVLVGAFVAAGYVPQELKQRRLIASGELVDATAVKVAGVDAHQNAHFGMQRDQTVGAEFSAVSSDGRLLSFGGDLPPDSGWIMVNQVVKLRIDPKNPNNWTEDVEARPWSRVLWVPVFLLLPIALGLLGVAEFRRRRVLRVWRDGVRAQGVVVDVRHAAAAPKSRIVHFTLAEGPDRRVFRTLYPLRAGTPQQGDTLTLLHLMDRPETSIVADLYVRPGDVTLHQTPPA